MGTRQLRSIHRTISTGGLAMNIAAITSVTIGALLVSGCDEPSNANAVPVAEEDVQVNPNSTTEAGVVSFDAADDPRGRGSSSDAADGVAWELPRRAGLDRRVVAGKVFDHLYMHGGEGQPEVLREMWEHGALVMAEDLASNASLVNELAQMGFTTDQIVRRVSEALSRSGVPVLSSIDEFSGAMETPGRNPLVVYVKCMVTPSNGARVSAARAAVWMEIDVTTLVGLPQFENVGAFGASIYNTDRCLMLTAPGQFVSGFNEVLDAVTAMFVRHVKEGRTGEPLDLDAGSADR